MLRQVARADDKVGILLMNGIDQRLDERRIDLPEVGIGDMDDCPQSL